MAIGDILGSIGSGIGKVVSGIGSAVGDVAGFLGGAVGDGLESLAENVKIVQDNLGRLGRYDRNPDGVLSKDLDSVIRDFQRDNDLKVDGKLYPGGETERSIFEALTGRDPNAIWRQKEGPGPGGFGHFPTTVPTQRPRPGGFLGALAGIGEVVVDGPPEEPRQKRDWDTAPWSERIARKRAAGGTLFGPDVGAGPLLPPDEPRDLSRYNLGDALEGLSNLASGFGGALGWGLGKVGDIFDGDDEADDSAPPPPPPEEPQKTVPPPPPKPDIIAEKAKQAPREQKEAVETEDDLFERFRENLREREGGIADRGPEADPGGLTNQGVSQRLLDALRMQNPNSGLPESTRDLTQEQIDSIFRDEFFDRPRISDLNDVPGLNEAAPNLVEHVFDAGVMSGDTDAGRWLQESIDEHMGTDLRNAQGEYDGIIGPQTRGTLEDAIRQGHALDISEGFADRRIEHLRGLSNYDANPGWELRVRNLRDQDPNPQ
jgi:lysozyme family protein/peptidoglycan hydrolase-like protein with peptidoglycan-binding domain